MVGTSCATRPHIEDTDPTRVEVIKMNYQSLANCVVENIEVTGVVRKTHVTFNEKEKIVKVSEPFGFVQDRKMFEFQFIRTKKNETKVESYGYRTLVGPDHYPNQIWPYVMKCAGKEHPDTHATFPGAQ